MMSEEEKKAIDELKQLKKDFEIVDKIVKDRDKQETKTIDAILNLIEKQQQELEQEKEKNKDLQKQLNGAFDRGFISKDKIKDFVSEKMKHLYVDSCAEDSGKYTAYKNILNLLEEK